MFGRRKRVGSRVWGTEPRCGASGVREKMNIGNIFGVAVSKPLCVGRGSGTQAAVSQSFLQIVACQGGLGFL
jgi:hypothetical protein